VRIGREMFLICCSPYPEREIELVAHLIAYDAADAYSARRRQHFETGRDVGRHRP